jgi:hypothetical protein
VIAFVAAVAVAVPTGTLRGEVRRGPTKPVCEVGVPCTAPAGGTAILFRRGTRTIRIRTDAAGRYRVVLAAGRWSISAPGPAIGRGVAPRTAVVVAGATRTIDLAIDTGIR